jgi:hypothetical protein
MKTKHTRTYLLALGLLAALWGGCSSTGGGTATIDPPAPLPGLPNPPAVTVPVPGK